MAGLASPVVTVDCWLNFVEVLDTAGCACLDDPGLDIIPDPPGAPVKKYTVIIPISAHPCFLEVIVLLKNFPSVVY